jgi:surfeit locus 1 family protein
MARAGLLARTLVSRQWWWVTLLVLAIMAVLARLGFWQLDRLAERRAANAQLAAALESAPIDLNSEIAAYEAIAPAEVNEDLANRDVSMAGAFDFDNQFILKLQNWGGIAGVHLITPFVLEGQNAVVLVDQGWISDAEYEAGRIYGESTGPQSVEGYVALTETIRRRTAEAAVPVIAANELYRVDIAAIQEKLPYPLAPFYVKLPQAEGSPPNLPIGTPKEADLSEGPHLSYAAQWFIFSLGLGIGYVVFVNRRLPAQAGADGPPESAQLN